MAIPLDSFDSDSVTIYPPPPWLVDGSRPIDWLRENAQRFAFDVDYIVNEAVTYQYGDGPYSPGIYFLVRGSSIIYVGQSNGISRRLRRHFDKFDMWADERWRFDRYWCFGGVPELFMEDVEAYYIELVGAQLNAGRVGYSDFKKFVSSELG